MEGSQVWDFERAIALCQEMYGNPIGEGRHRIVFGDGDYVVKCPTSASGVSACDEEVYGAHFVDMYAKTSLDPLSKEVAPINLTRMERVKRIEELDYDPILPSWVNSIDCQQVGYTKDGRLVAYDWERY